jgi:uncharacterized membrane protein (UPF0182 family)
VLVAAIVAVVSARGAAVLYTDYLWFGSLEFDGVWLKLLWAKVGLALLFMAAVFGIVWVNLVVADRLAPGLRPPVAEESGLGAVLAFVDRRPRALRFAAALVAAVLLGAGAGARWNEWLLLRNGVEFGVADPQFGRDVGFYVFQLPFVSFVVDWLFGTLLVVTLIVAVAHYLNGGIRLQIGGRAITAPAMGHISLLLALVALVRSIGYGIDRFELTVSERGLVHGATYTDVNAHLPAINLLAVISVLSAALFLYNVRRRGSALPIIAVGLWALVALVAGRGYPAIVQRFIVEPAESAKETPFIDRNIKATRAAMGLDVVEARPFAYEEELTPEALVANAETIRNVRLWDPQVLRRTYQRLQEVRTFYRFTDVDVDRYVVDDRLTQIVLSARELNSDSLPSDTWENRRLAFTHGYGAVLSPANAVTADGQPAFLVKNIPPQGEPQIAQSRLYHGELIAGYAIVGSGRDEIDFLRDDGTAVSNRYDGRGGVPVRSLLRRVAFALRFADINPVISPFMTSESRILYIRDIRERARTIAPFLHYDTDPYPVVLDGRVTWLMDAYTTTDRYPYAQRANRNRLDPASGLNHEFNYVRNSVKVAVDAYHGDVTFFVVDPSDPILAAYVKAFPGLFKGADEVPEGLRAHFRYPEDLFRVQTNMWGRYHIGDPREFYSQSDRWTIAQHPGADVPVPAQGAGGAPPVSEPDAPREGRMDPYYLLTRLPGAPRPEFLILQPFVPFSKDDTRRELSGFMVAKSDPHDYGKLEVFVMPRDRQVDGPAIVNARINQEPEVSQLITLLSRAGSEVLLGNLLIIPVEQSLIYIRPLYVQATGANAVPELKKVIVAFGEQIAIRDSLQDALMAVFGGAPDTLEEGHRQAMCPPRSAACSTRLPGPSPRRMPPCAQVTRWSTPGRCRRAAGPSSAPSRQAQAAAPRRLRHRRPPGEGIGPNSSRRPTQTTTSARHHGGPRGAYSGWSRVEILMKLLQPNARRISS